MSPTLSLGRCLTDRLDRTQGEGVTHAESVMALAEAYELDPLFWLATTLGLGSDDIRAVDDDDDDLDDDDDDDEDYDDFEDDEEFEDEDLDDDLDEDDDDDEDDEYDDDIDDDDLDWAE